MAEKGSHTVLVVDDDPGHRGMLEALLGRWGLAVTSAGDGKEAVARVCERPFDVVLMDIRMPDMRGDEFLHAVKSDERFRHIRMVMLSSEDSTSERIQLLQDGAEDYIVKPFNPMELKVRIEKFLK